MKCIDKELIQKYLDNEASHDEVDAVEKHLDECPECARKIVRRKHLCQDIIFAINQLSAENQPVPDFIHPKVQPERKLLNGKRVLYGACAAILLFFVVILTPRSYPDHQFLLKTDAWMEVEVDANRPVTKQPVLIQVTDPEGNITEYTVN